LVWISCLSLRGLHLHCLSGLSWPCCACGCYYYSRSCYLGLFWATGGHCPNIRDE
jgi:hypothetical protein